MFRKLIMKSKEYKRLEAVLKITTRERDQAIKALARMQNKCEKLINNHKENLEGEAYD